MERNRFARLSLVADWVGAEVQGQELLDSLAAVDIEGSPLEDSRASAEGIRVVDNRADSPEAVGSPVVAADSLVEAADSQSERDIPVEVAEPEPVAGAEEGVAVEVVPAEVLIRSDRVWQIQNRLLVSIRQEF